MSSWYEQLSDGFPNTTVTSAALSAVEDLPGIHNWIPKAGLSSRRLDILHWGLRLDLTQRLKGMDDLKRRLANSILADDRPAQATFAELSAAALCVALGAEEGARIARAAFPTPDWRLSWRDASPVDVEVTAATTKPGHIARRSIATEVANQLSDPSRTDDVIVHLADPLSGPSPVALAKHVKALAPGQMCEESPRWRLQRQPIDREVTTIYVAGKPDPKPDWWPDLGFRLLFFHGMLAGPDTIVAPPQVRVYYGVPFDAYINPVQKKADKPQAAAGAPYLITIDIADLPGAFRELARQLPANWSIWPQVSGILLFRDVLSQSRSGWEWLLLVNSSAQAQLPPSLVARRPPGNEISETGCNFWSTSAGT